MSVTTFATAAIRMHDSVEPDRIAWSELRNGPLARSLIRPYLGIRSCDLIANTDHRVLLAEVGGQAIPLVVNDGRDSDCYLTSPYTNHIVYAREFVQALPQRRWRWPLMGLIAVFAALVRRRDVDRVVYVNHWLLATGPRPSLSSQQLSALKRAILQQFPNHAIVLRGVRGDAGGVLDPLALRDGWKSLFNRIVFVWSRPKDEMARPPREFRQDRRRLVDAGDLVQPAASLEAEQRIRLRDLYNILYIEKYSAHNPRLNARWFDTIPGSEHVDTHLIEAEGAINYFVLSFETEDEIIGSVVGHQPEISRRLGLYRMGISLLMRRAAERSLPLNLSSGSGMFKSKRGAVPVVEHDWLNVAHLGWRTRFSWWLLASAYNRIARPLYEALEI